MKKTLYLFIFLGILLRLILMPFTVHPDLRGHYLGASFIAREGQMLGVYDYISRLPRTDPIVQLYHDDFLVYSPLTYLLHAAWLFVAGPFISWDLFDHFELDMGQAVFDPGFPYLAFILKTPYLIADIAILILLLKVVVKEKTLAVAFWAINLPLIHSAFMMGQFDIFMVLAMLAAFFFTKKDQPVLAAVCLALGAGFKPFPLFLIPFLPGKLWKNLLAGGLTYGAMIFPYFISSPGYRMYALVAQHSDKLWYAKVLVSGSQYLPLFFVGLVVSFWIKYFKPAALPLLGWLSVPLLMFYSFTHFHPQWFSWFSVFLIILVVSIRQIRPMALIIFGCYLAVVFSFETSLNFGLFGIDFGIQKYLSDQTMSAVRAVLAGTCLLVPFVIYSFHHKTPALHQENL